MDAIKKLKTAKMLMLLGMAPLCMGIAHVVFVATNALQSGSGLSDVLMGIFLLVFSYLVSVLVAGGSAVWSMMLMHKHQELRSDAAGILWKIILLLLALPALCLIFLI